MSQQPATPIPNGSLYLRVLRNRALMLLWSGQSVSVIGDRFFNLAVGWAVYTHTGSALQTALISGVVWHIPSIVFGPFAGIVVDRRNRKLVMIASNLLAAVVVAAFAALISLQGVSTLPALAAVFLLNSVVMPSTLARNSLMPEVAGRDLVATASGLFTTVRNLADMAGSALGGVTVAAFGAVWAVAGDAVSFLIAAVAFAAARLPSKVVESSSAVSLGKVRRPSYLEEARDGWRAMMEHPVVRAMAWLGMLVNVVTFIGPLYPALVTQQLRAGATALGAIGAAGVVGAMAGGAFSGALERRFGAGPVLIAGWALAGAFIVVMGLSPWLPLTAAMEAASNFGIVAGDVSMGALAVTLIPESYRGRVGGILGAASVVSIPISSLVGGWLADLIGAGPMFVLGGAYALGIAALAWSNRHVRAARILAESPE